PEDPNDQLSNPLALSQLLDNGNSNTGIRGNVYLDIKPVEALSLRTEYAADLGMSQTHSFVPTYQLGSVYNSEISNTQTQRYSNNWSWRNVATYNQRFGRWHVVNATLGQELTERTYNYTMAKRRGGSNQLRDIDAGDALTAENGGNSGRVAYSSYFGRVF